MKAIDVANFFIDLYNSVPEGQVTNLSLNKLLYFAQGHSLAENGKPLFDEPIEAWQYGPVVPSVYHTFKKHRRSRIPSTYGNYTSDIFSSEDLDLLLDVFQKYKIYSPNYLVSLTHEEGAPWKDVYSSHLNNEITQEALRDYFSKHKLKRFSVFPLAKEETEICRNSSGIRLLPADWRDEDDD